MAGRAYGQPAQEKQRLWSQHRWLRRSVSIFFLWLQLTDFAPSMSPIIIMVHTVKNIMVKLTTFWDTLNVLPNLSASSLLMRWEDCFALLSSNIHEIWVDSRQHSGLWITSQIWVYTVRSDNCRLYQTTVGTTVCIQILDGDGKGYYTFRIL